jgi:hypothetical protein
VQKGVQKLEQNICAGEHVVVDIITGRKYKAWCWRFRASFFSRYKLKLRPKKERRRARPNFRFQ